MIDYREDARWTVYVHIVPREISGYDYDKYYVGITGIPVKRRWQGGSGYIGQKFYDAIKKYTWNDIIHQVVATNLTKDEACDMEQSLIALLNSNDGIHGYNFTIGGDGTQGYIWSDEARKEWSQRMSGENNHFYGKKHSKETRALISANHADFSGGNNANAKEVYQFIIDGQFVAKFDSCMTASKQTGIHDRGISYAALHNKTAGGYLWVYSDNIIEVNGIYQIKEYKYVTKKLTNKEVFQFDLDGNFVNRYISCVEAGKATNISKDSIGSTARGYQKSTNGFIWRYRKDVIERDGSFFIV